LLDVSYATVVPLTNCGESAFVSKLQSVRACAGSWMSRITTVGSPTTVPMTMLSPAGTGDGQWTAEAIVDGVGSAEGELAAVAAGVKLVVDVVFAVGVEGAEHAVLARIAASTAAAGVTRTAQL
jgi:hypothetical protein